MAERIVYISSITFADTCYLRYLFRGSKRVNFLFLGKNFVKKCNIEKKLGSKFSSIPIAKLHSEIADSIRKDFFLWVEDLNNTHGRDIEWWFERLSSRNIHQSDIFQYFCYLVLIDRYIRKEKTSPQVVFVDSSALANCIIDKLRREGISAHLISHSFLLLNIRKLLYSVWDYMRFAFDSIILVTAGILFLRKSVLDVSAQSIFIDTFLHENSLDENGEFKDKYFPFLYEYLSKNGYSVTVHPVFQMHGLSLLKTCKKISISRSGFIIKENFLSFLDYAYAFLFPVRHWRRRVVPAMFLGADVAAIVREERFFDHFSNGIQACLTYLLFRRLSEHKKRPGYIIDWNENQIIDKALIAGARNAFENIKIIGAQLLLHFPNFLNLYPLPSELRARVLPDSLLCTSRYQCEIAAKFLPNLAVRPAAALRYNHVFNLSTKKNSYVNHREPSVAILLSCDISESMELLKISISSLQELPPAVTFYVKCHPDLDQGRILREFRIKDIPGRFHFSKDALSDLLEKADVVIGSSSGSIVEAAAKGIPVIFIGRSSALNQNLFSGIKSPLVEECFDVQTLAKIIKERLCVSETQKATYSEAARELRDLFFMRVTDENMSPFLEKNAITS